MCQRIGNVETSALRGPVHGQEVHDQDHVGFGRQSISWDCPRDRIRIRVLRRDDDRRDVRRPSFPADPRRIRERPSTAGCRPAPVPSPVALQEDEIVAAEQRRSLIMRSGRLRVRRLRLDEVLTSWSSSPDAASARRPRWARRRGRPADHGTNLDQKRQGLVRTDDVTARLPAPYARSLGMSIWRRRVRPAHRRVRRSHPG